MRVELTITRKIGSGIGTIVKVLDVEKQDTNYKTVMEAKLQWLNKYLNRESNWEYTTNYSYVKSKVPNISIEGKTLD